MSGERLSPERLAEIRERWPEGERWVTMQARPDIYALLAHIDAQQAEIVELANALDLLHDRDVWMHCDECQHPKCLWRRKDVADAEALLDRARAAGLLQ